MNIPGIPEKIRHEDWLAALRSLGFAPEVANILELHTDDNRPHLLTGRSSMVVTTKTGHQISVPFDFSREADA